MNIIYKNTDIGKLHDIKPDMWYLEGVLKINESPESNLFKTSCLNLNPKEVYMDLEKGIEVILVDTNDKTEMNFTIISLENDILWGRRTNKS